MPEIDREELAWAAGFFDGEGHIRFNQALNPNGSIRLSGLRIHIPQTEPTTLERFRRAVLGLGVIDGPRQATNPKHSPQWLWRAARFSDTQAVVALLWAFLSEPKRRQAKGALTAFRSRRRRGGAECARGHSDWMVDAKGHRHCSVCLDIAAARKKARYHALHPSARYNPYPARRKARRTQGGPYMHAE